MNYIKNSKKVKNMIKTAVLILNLILIFTFFSCKTNQDYTNKAAANIKKDIEKESNIFDAREIKPGDTIVGMEVKAVEVKPNINSGYEDDYSATVEFTGKVQISGIYKINNNDEFLGNLVSFIADEESATKVPKLSHDTRYVWFVFENTDKALETFKTQGIEGMATIIIDNYTINYAPSDIYNTALLIELVARG